jgi:hypothetical protein
MIAAEGGLGVAGFFARDVPGGHPAELRAFAPRIEHDGNG